MERCPTWSASANCRTPGCHARASPKSPPFLPALHPQLTQNPDAVAELIYEELCLREESGQYDAAEEILRRFPQWQKQFGERRFR